MPEPATTPMPVIYLSHGAPPLADDTEWTGQLAAWSADLPKPAAILVVSAHWEEAPLTLGATDDRASGVRLLGLPGALLPGPVRRTGRPRPGRQGPQACSRRRSTTCTMRRHAGSTTAPTCLWSRCSRPPTYRPCRSRCRRSTPRHCSRSVASCDRCATRACLILGSGFTTHNLRLIDMHRPSDAPAPGWSREFDDWIAARHRRP